MARTLNVNIERSGEMRSGETRRVYRFEYALALVLFLTLALPLPLMLLRGFTDQPILEWRQGIPAGGIVAPITGGGNAGLYGRWERKAKAITEDATEFQEAFARSFWGRTPLREGYAGLLVEIFGVSPAPEVIVGKSGWLFFTGDSSLEGYRGLNSFRPNELELLRRTQAARRTVLENRGIAHLVILPPDKQTIYPELMPASYTRLGPSRLEQTVAYLRGHPGVEFIDLRPALEKFKSENPRRPLYYKSDTHWNPVGAYSGYRAVAERLQEKFPAIRPLELSDMNLSESEVDLSQGDLSSMIQLKGRKERKENLRPRYSPPNLPENAVWGYVAAHTDSEKTVITEFPTGEIGRAVIFHDSFMKGMSVYLTRHFRRAVWRWGKYDPALVAQEKPDLVIDERVERGLNQWVGR